MKYIKISLLAIGMFFLFNINCYASINTYTRSEDNLLVPKDVVIDVNNMNDIINTPAVSSSEKVYDYADLLSDSQEQEVYKKLIDYTNTTGIDAVIITSKDLGGYTTGEFINNFYNYNDFMDNAVVFLTYMAEDEPQIYMISEGKGSKFYTQKRIPQILEYVYKDIDKGDYNKAVDDYINILSGFYNLDGNYKVDKNGKIIQDIPWIEIIILAGTLTFIIVMAVIYKVSPKKNLKGNLYNRINPSTLMVRTDSDEEIVTGVSNN